MASASLAAIFALEARKYLGRDDPALIGLVGLFAVCAGAMLLWLVVAWPMVAPARANLVVSANVA